MNTERNSAGFNYPNKNTITADGRQQPLILQEITVRPVVRKTQDIAAWRRALVLAEATVPRRTELYDLYEDIRLDGHLRSVLEKRIMAVTGANWAFVTKDGEAVELFDKVIDTPEFELMVAEILSTKFYGYTMLEFDFAPLLAYLADPDNVDPGFGCYLIPRKHMRPKLGEVSFEQASDAGVNVRDGFFKDTVLEAGDANDLGLLLCAAQYVIYKRGSFGDWAQFAEVFGMPLIDATWDGYDEGQRLKLLEALKQMGGGGQLVRPQGTTVDLKQNTNNPDGSLYSNLISALNAELSKVILGNTETTESSDSSGYAQSETHAAGENALNANDLKYVRRILNKRFVRLMQAWGIDTRGGKFIVQKEAVTLEVSPTDQLTNIKTIKNDLGVPVDDDYIYETFNVPKPKNYDAMKAAQDAQRAAQQMPAYQMSMPRPGETQDQWLLRMADFFDGALQRQGT